MQVEQQGQLICVGVGISIGAHITPIVKNTIAQADIVFAAASDGLFELWLQDIHPNVVSLQQYYSEGKSRKITYQEMIEALLEPVRQNKKVVAVFYGHPGVFVNPSHKAIKKAHDEGYQAHMLPGISAEDCLYADLGIDPGKYGCQHYETSQFMFYQRVIDPTAYLILWQPIFAGDRSHTIREAKSEYFELLKNKLYETYPSDHLVTIYQAATNAFDHQRSTKVKLVDLNINDISQQSTLVIPPAKSLILCPKMTSNLQKAKLLSVS